jgi:hypothetical protein
VRRFLQQGLNEATKLAEIPAQLHKAIKG